MSNLSESETMLVEKALQLMSTPCRKTSPSQWLHGFRELAAITHGITQEDPRFPGIMDALAACDSAFQGDNWMAFRRGAERVKKLCSGLLQAG